MSKTITALQNTTPELRLQMLNAVNQVHFVLESIQNRDQAVAFNEAISGPLRKIQNFYGLPSGNVVKIGRKIA